MYSSKSLLACVHVFVSRAIRSSPTIANQSVYMSCGLCMLYVVLKT